MKGSWLFALGLGVGAALAVIPKAVMHLHSAILAAGSASSASRLHTEEKFSFVAQAPLERVAPLFGAAGERLWAPHWNPRFIYPLPASDRQGMVFAVEHPHARAVWVNTDFDVKNGRVQYVYMIPDVLVSVITLKLTATGDQTRVEVHYDRTALSAESEPHVQHLAREDHNAGTEWEALVNTYLAKAPAGAVNSRQ